MNYIGLSARQRRITLFPEVDGQHVRDIAAEPSTP
jgi:hypothetical protein